MLRIVLIDDHPVVRAGMRALLEAEVGWSVVGEAADGLSAIRVIEELQPDLAVIDIMLPDLNGIEVVRRISERGPRPKTIVLSMHADDSYVLRAFQSGASAYVLKSVSTSMLITAIHEVLAGRRFLAPPLSQDRIDAYLERASTANQPIDRYHLLTRREREVLNLVAQGLTNNQVGGRLSISPRTVESHRANLMRKLGFQTSADLYHFAVQRGLVE